MSATYTISIPEWIDRIFTRPLMIYRKFKYGCGYRRIYLGEGEYTKVDADIFYRLGGLRWQIKGNGKRWYVVRFKKVRPGLTTLENLHRVIIKARKGRVVDHLNCDPLDNCRMNLRQATQSQNHQNVLKKKNTSSKYIGVSFRKEIKKWGAYTSHKGKKKHLGYFLNEIDAARAYDKAVKKYFGPYARVNFAKN